ncbi:maltose ABC transporter permease MalF [Zooshikella sp. RANM57]|uniref:maltose ABC transporter permease MalF n=1 Tax=Zooshikella sp. RANM57 TaxID=3425863 RepID=UPI003D6DD37F
MLTELQLSAFLRFFKRVLPLSVIGVGLYLVVVMYVQQQLAFAGLFLVVLSAAAFVFCRQEAYAHRYVFPAVAGMVIFVIFPLLYTIGISFTNYSAKHLLDLPKAQQYFLQQTYKVSDKKYKYYLYFQQQKTSEKTAVIALVDDENHTTYLSSNILLVDAINKTVALTLVSELLDQKPATIKAIIKHKKQLKNITLNLPNGQHLQWVGLRHFAAVAPLYQLNDQQQLINQKTGDVLSIDWQTGFYKNNQGVKFSPGFKTYVGWKNYITVLFDPSISGPFIQIFVWTIVFSLCTVVFTLLVGLILANLLQWELLKGKGFYRMMLILPYAVPAFISILVFKGLFNQNAGEVNYLLGSLLGVRPDWFSDPLLARTMILIVNTWLGYPYMLLLCMGLLQAIPKDLYEASAIDGASPWRNLMSITLPQIIKPLTPLLIASFAFNFNNFVLITLLTSGGPDIIGATTPAGTTDLLVSYTYRLAFQDSGQNFGMAAAIATLIFLLVGALAVMQLRLSKVKV